MQKNNIEIDYSKIIDYKALQNGSKQSRQNYSKKEKEQGFVLDCMNVEKSKLKDYAPLKDKNLKYYFKNDNNKKYLVQRGLIDRQGYIMYDREYRRVYGSPNYLRRNRENQDKKSNSLSKVIFELSLKNDKLNDNKNFIITENIRTKEKVPK